MTDSISYQTYDKKSLIVFGDRKKFQKNINLIGGRWNAKKSGWVLPMTNKNKLEAFITSLGNNTTVQKKYSREDSDNSVDSVDELEDITDIEPVTQDENSKKIPVIIQDTLEELVDKVPDILFIKDEDVSTDNHDIDDSNHMRESPAYTESSVRKRYDIVRESKHEESPRPSSTRYDSSRRDHLTSSSTRQYNPNMSDERRRYDHNKQHEFNREVEFRDERQNEHSRRLQIREEQERRNNAKQKYGKPDPRVYDQSLKNDISENPYSYYKSFNKKPVDFRKINGISDSESDSSSEEECSSSERSSSSSSSDSFPSPRTPRRREEYNRNSTQNYDQLFSHVRDLQKRMHDIEINNKRYR